MKVLRFDGQIAVVTGAGRNIGRTFALALAERGAKVVVNDLGVAISDTDGSGVAPASNPAHDVVAEIMALGGEAVANTDTIATEAGGAGIIATALDAWGRIDVLVNNAGVVRTGPFEDFTGTQVDDMLDTQVRSLLHVTKPAWIAMAASGGGRVLNLSSGAATGGIANHAFYGGAKMAVIGVTRALATEGRPVGIRVNAMAPYAKTRAGTPFGPIPWSDALGDWLSPSQIAPLAVYLVHYDTDITGEVFHVGGGHIARVVIGVDGGFTKRDATPEDIAANIDTIIGDGSIRETTSSSGGVIGEILRGFRPR
jgi:NAD(P)-dependent dehydrogenase (short-subunit alcohol dehydrogenase family)